MNFFDCDIRKKVSRGRADQDLQHCKFRNFDIFSRLIILEVDIYCDFRDVIPEVD